MPPNKSGRLIAQGGIRRLAARCAEAARALPNSRRAVSGSRGGLLLIALTVAVTRERRVVVLQHLGCLHFGVYSLIEPRCLQVFMLAFSA